MSMFEYQKKVLAWKANPIQGPAEWIQEHVDLNNPISVGCYAGAAINQHVDALALALCPHLSGRYIALAAQYASMAGNLDVLKLVCPDKFPEHDHEPETLSTMLIGALSNKHHHLLDWFVAHPDAATMRATFTDRKMFIRDVCARGDERMVEIMLPWLPSETIGEEALDNAVKTGHTNIALCLLKSGIPSSEPDQHLRYALDWEKTELAEKLWPFSDPVTVVQGIRDLGARAGAINTAEDLWSPDQLDALLTANPKARWIKECPVLCARATQKKIEAAIHQEATSSLVSAAPRPAPKM